MRRGSWVHRLSRGYAVEISIAENSVERPIKKPSLAERPPGDPMLRAVTLPPCLSQRMLLDLKRSCPPATAPGIRPQATDD